MSDQKVTIDIDRCKGCQLCLDVCPNFLIVRSDELHPEGYYPAKIVDGEYCISCGDCVSVCPDRAIALSNPGDTWAGRFYWLGRQLGKSNQLWQTIRRQPKPDHEEES